MPLHSPRRAGLLISMAALVLLAWAFVARADNWPMAGHDPQRTGCSKDYVVGPFQYRWVKYFHEKVTFAQLIVWGKRGYFGTMQGNVYCIDTDTGDPVWKTPVGALIFGSVATDGKKVFAVASNGVLYGLDAADGKILWRFQGHAGSVCHLLLIDGKVVYTDKGGYCYAVSADTGKELWEYKAGAMILNSPASDGKRVFFGSEDMVAHALDLQTGKQLWQVQLTGESLSESWPVVSLAAGVVHFSPKPLRFSYAKPRTPEQAAANTPGAIRAKLLQRSLPTTEKDSEALQQMLVDYLKNSPEHTHFCLSTATGKELYIVPVLYTCGRWATPAPPCVDPDGNFLFSFMFPPRRAGQPSWQYGCTYQGIFNSHTGRLISAPQSIGITGWDEFYAFTMAGHTYFKNEWSMVDVKDFDGRGRWHIDMPGHYMSNRKEGGYPGWMGGAMQNGSNGVSVANGRVYCIAASYISCADGRIKGQGSEGRAGDR